MSGRKKLLAIDGNSIINRAFYGVRPLTTADGRQTGAIYGFLNIIQKQIDALCPDAIVAAFDLRAPTFRHKKYDKYKANRKGMPEELFEQLEPVKRACELLGIHVLSLEGYEADDILGSCAKCAYTEDIYDCYILTGDRDSLQLIGEKSFVLLATNKEVVHYDTEKIKEVYGVLPTQLLDVKALMGDSSDNVPGVAGIGEKTALKLIADFGSLDALYENLESASISAGLKEKLKCGKEDAYLSRFLCEIYKDVPLPLGFEDVKRKDIDSPALLRFLLSFELKSLISRYGVEGAAERSCACGEKTKLEIKEISSFSEIPSVSMLFSEPDFENGRIYCFADALYKLPLTPENMRGIFTNQNTKTALYNSKSVYSHLISNGIENNNCAFDFMLCAYVLSKGKNSSVCELVPPEELEKFAAETNEEKLCAALTLLPKLYEDFLNELAENSLEKLYYEIEFPLSLVLAKMECFGFKIDADGLSQFSDTLNARILERQSNIYTLAGTEFNINSTQQLANVLFERLSLPGFKKTKTGYSTDAETLEKLRPYHPIIDEILDYRAVTKLKSTYADGLLKAVDKESGRIHTSFNQAQTATGRLSSAEPNLQNIPIRQPEGKLLRKFFIPENEDYVFIDADYSQIELRILAALSKDEKMISAFENGTDIHTLTASEIFSVPKDEVTPQMRSSAKAVNFGIIYGISDFSLAADIGVSRKMAAEYIEKYFAKYPKIKEYLDQTIENAVKDGYACTLFGRRRYIPELSAKNKIMQNFGKRVAMNSPIQGTAADIIKIAMINTDRELTRAGLDARLVLQVHDELIVECKKSDAQEAIQILKSCMESAADLPVKLSCEIESGSTWYDAH